MAHFTQDADSVTVHIRIPKTNNLPARVMAAMIGTYGPIPVDENGEATLTDQEFAYRQLRQVLVSALRGYEGRIAADAAANQAADQADLDSNGID